MKKLTSILLTMILMVSFVLNVQAQNRLNEITKRGVLKVGMSGEQPPFNMEAKDGSLIGYEVDMAKLLATAMNLELELVRIPFKDLIPSLQEGKVDLVMSGMTITMERNMKVAFIGPYLVSGKSILTKSANLAKAEEAEDLNQTDLRISSLKGSTSQEFVETLLPQATSMPADNYDQAVQSLLSDQANVMVADFPVCALTILRNPEAGLVTLAEPLTIEPIGMALPADDPLLMNFITNYFNAMTMGGLLTKLELYWFQSGAWLPNMK